MSNVAQQSRTETVSGYTIVYGNSYTYPLRREVSGSLRVQGFRLYYTWNKDMKTVYRRIHRAIRAYSNYGDIYYNGKD